MSMPMSEVDRQVLNGVANLLAMQDARHCKSGAGITTEWGVLTLQATDVNVAGWGPEITLKFVAPDGEPVYYRLELKNEDGPLTID